MAQATSTAALAATAKTKEIAQPTKLAEDKKKRKAEKLTTKETSLVNKNSKDIKNKLQKIVGLQKKLERKMTPCRHAGWPVPSRSLSIQFSIRARRLAGAVVTVGLG